MAVVMFSLCQYKNILWAFQTAWFLVTFFLSVCLLFLEKANRSQQRRVTFSALAALSAVLASFCSIRGLITWATGLVFILAKNNFSARKSSEDSAARVWVGAAVSCVLVFAGIWLATPGQSPGLSGGILERSGLVLRISGTCGAHYDLLP
jgi:hypothetical protein